MLQTRLDRILFRVLIGSIAFVCIMIGVSFGSQLWQAHVTHKLLDAASRGDVAGVRWLLSYGADPSGKVPGDSTSNTALELAARGGHAAAAVVLIEHGANSDANVPAAVANMRDPAPMLALVAHGYDAGQALQMATTQGNGALVRALLTRAPGGRTRAELDNMLVNASMMGKPDVVRALADSGAHVDVGAPAQPTPLFQAVSRRDAAMVETLLAAGAKPDRAWNGDTPLSVALRNQDDVIVQQLKRAGANPARDPGVMRERAQQLESQGKSLEAEAQYRAVLAANPGDRDAQMRLSSLIRSREQVDAEVERYRTNVRRSPGDRYQVLQLGDLLLRIGRRSEALATYRDLVKGNPGWAEAHIRLAKALEAAGNTKGASVEYQLAGRVGTDGPG
jgi:ankyrin repeat protein